MDESHEISLRNEEIARKFRAIEKNISYSRSVKDLFEEFLMQTESELAIPYVWLTVIDRPEAHELLKELETSGFLKERLNIVALPILMHLTNDAITPILANDNLRPFYQLLPRRKKYFIKSLALAPIIFDNKVIGSLNFGDYSKLRYQPGMDTGLLNKLAKYVSSRMSDLVMKSKSKVPLCPESAE